MVGVASKAAVQWLANNLRNWVADPKALIYGILIAVTVVLYFLNVLANLLASADDATWGLTAGYTPELAGVLSLFVAYRVVGRTIRAFAGSWVRSLPFSPSEFGVFLCAVAHLAALMTLIVLSLVGLATFCIHPLSDTVVRSINLPQVVGHVLLAAVLPLLGTIAGAWIWAKRPRRTASTDRMLQHVITFGTYAGTAWVQATWPKLDHPLCTLLLWFLSLVLYGALQGTQIRRLLLRHELKSALFRSLRLSASTSAVVKRLESPRLRNVGSFLLQHRTSSGSSAYREYRVVLLFSFASACLIFLAGLGDLAIVIAGGAGVALGSLAFMGLLHSIGILSRLLRPLPVTFSTAFISTTRFGFIGALIVWAIVGFSGIGVTSGVALLAVPGGLILMTILFLLWAFVCFWFPDNPFIRGLAYFMIIFLCGLSAVLLPPLSPFLAIAAFVFCFRAARRQWYAHEPA